MWTFKRRTMHCLCFSAVLACTPKAETAKAETAETSPPVAAATVVPSSAAQPAAASATGDTIPAKAYQAWKQYEAQCARCHGEFGVGSSFAPSLVASVKAGMDQATFTKVGCEGRPEKGMPAGCEMGLTKEQIADIYAYFKLRADGKVGAVRPVSAAA